ncbi:MAG: carboxypeptidase regulatory-like domain-containing protein [Planctomycetes bacterium]|nr:carboxypeptidase regulatory-like domain-containing protein [Planctomycetota bacterium]
MPRFLLTFRNKHAAAAAALLLATACVKSGTEIGPKLPDIEDQAIVGVVTDPDSNPVSGAYITIGNDTVFTDQRGRFRFRNKQPQAAVVRVDARLTGVATPAGGILDRMSVRGNFIAPTGVMSAPIILPNFTKGASAAIAVNGSALAGTLADPATGAELILNGATATLAGSNSTTATIYFTSIPANAISAPLDVAGAVRAGALYFAISPADLIFTNPPVVRVGDAIFGIAAAIGAGKTVTPELDRLDDSTGVWTLDSPASVGGGFVTSAAAPGGGIYCISVGSPGANRTIVSARLLDQNLDPMQTSFALARDGRSSSADSNGLLAIPDVAGADANGAPLSIILQMCSTPYRTQHLMRVDALPAVLGAGLVTDFGDRALATVPAGRVRVLPIFEGKKYSDARVGVGSVFGGRIEDSQLSTPAGTEFWDVPAGLFEVTGVDLFNDVNAIRSATRASLKFGGSTVDLQLFLQRSRLRTQAQIGSIRDVALRSGSLTPIYNCFHMIGLDGAGNHAGFSNAPGVGFAHVLPGSVLTTAAQQVSASAFGAAGVDAYETRAFHTQLSTASYRRTPVAAFLNYLPKGFDRAGAFFGNITQLTDPGAVPPGNGAYAVEVRPHHSGTFEKRIAVALGAEEEDAAMPPSPKRPNFNNPAWEALVPQGHSTVAVVERDAASATATAGKITKIGILTNALAKFGEREMHDLALDTIPNAQFSTTILGAPAPQRISLVLMTADGQGVDAGDQSNFTFNSGNGAFDAAVPSIVDGGAAAIASATGTTANGSDFYTGVACVFGETGASQLLNIPALTAPAPPPASNILISPTTTGISWTGDANASETVITIKRKAKETESNGEITDRTSQWTVRLPGGPSSFVFPTTPSNAKNIPVPVFFTSGKTYQLTIESRRYLNYDERTAATSPDAAKASHFQVRAVARATVDVEIP